CSYHAHGPDEETHMSAALYDGLLTASTGKLELFGASGPGAMVGATDELGTFRIQEVSGDAFRILGVNPALGRMLTQADNGHDVAVLNYEFWSRSFGSNPNVLGRWVHWAKPFQIVGVAPKGFDGLSRGYRTDVWLPKLPAASVAGAGWFQVWGSLMPGVAPEQARLALQMAFTNYRRDHSAEFLEEGGLRNQLENYINERLNLRPGASGGWSYLRMSFERPFWIVGAVALMVLLIACSNVANLLVARAAAREREMAMRISIGAGRFRLIQQMLIESGLLAAAACVLGLTIASAAAPAIVNLLSPSNDPAYLDLRIGWRSLAFVAAIGVATTVFFGLAPALRASSIAPQEALKAGGAKQSARIDLLRPLLASQVSFSFVVLFIGGILLLSFYRISGVDLGFSKDHVVLFDLFKQGDQVHSSAERLVNQVRAIPTVQAAAMSAPSLMGGDFVWIQTPGIRFPGRARESVSPVYLSVTPGFFETMRIPVLTGRGLEARDMKPGTGAVVVNQEFARRYLAGENPLGKRFEQTGDDPAPISREIVGVVRDAKVNNLRESPRPIIYGPLLGMTGTLEVRTAGDPLAVTTAIRETIVRTDPTLELANVILQTAQINNTLLRERLLALLAGFFAVVAVLLAAIGLYGVLSYSVVRRTKEIGIRIALGARQPGVVRLVISDVLLLIAIGLGMGAAGGLALSRFVTSLLFQVKAGEFWSLALPLACFLAASTLATLPPAWRAARMDPVVALREE
ncbi:MAG TPA: ADOP family duplicated permease, partial [Bryobacteraceae bacterium]|nr:ADOP family duplicated permease [Bryobacteraceae bacterium]